MKLRGSMKNIADGSFFSIGSSTGGRIYKTAFLINKMYYVDVYNVC